MREDLSPQDWLKKFRASLKGRTALEMLQEQCSGDTEYWLLEQRVLEACYYAAAFDPSHDQWAQLRTRDKHIPDLSKHAADALRTVIEFAQRYPKEFSFPAGEAMRHAHLQGTSIAASNGAVSIPKRNSDC